MKKLGWSQLDIILVTGDSYIDSPYIGVSVIGRVLQAAGYRVGIIAQPTTDTGQDITRLGQPKFFWGVSGGCVDSMVANYTASKKRRKSDDFTPGGINNRRPDRAVIVYTNLIKRFCKPTQPIVIGGIEASLRRVAHYDYWSNSIRRSLLFDAKADILVYGMAEKTILKLAETFRNSKNYRTIQGLCYISPEAKADFIRLPDYKTVKRDKKAFVEMFHLFYHNNDPITANGLVQKQDNRFLIQNPPSPHLSSQELDRIHELNYSNDQHPFYAKKGAVRALETIRFSITSHRGCYGECHFCAIAIHQGRTVTERSEQSIIKEATRLTHFNRFKGNIMDVGGPTANMYGFECNKKKTKGSCKEKRCLFPTPCPGLKISHKRQMKLLKELAAIPNIKKIFIGSGLRYDLILADQTYGRPYLKQLIQNHISGQLKIAPEHTEKKVLSRMGKPDADKLLIFKNLFYKLTGEAGKNQFLTYYFIAAHPDCQEGDMTKLRKFCQNNLKTRPQQVQIFTPTPSTYSSLMYYCQTDPFTNKPLFVEKDIRKKELQKQIVFDPPLS